MLDFINCDSNMINPLVSVCCLAYNQESFIVQAIEGFLIQKTNFPIEIIIHDDASTDKTAQIIKEYVKDFPELIVPIFQTENQYSTRYLSILNSFVFPLARGKYIAICEGDDYWTDPLKLQKQVDFLEANPDYGMVYTNAKVYHQDSRVFEKRGLVSVKNLLFEQLLTNVNIPALTVLIRNSFVVQYRNEIQPELRKWLMADYPLWLFTAKKSKLKYLDDITAVYRVLKESGSHSSSSQKNLAFLLSIFEIRIFFSSKYHVNDQIILSIMNDYYKKTIYYALQNNDFIHVEECVKFLREHKMNIELWVVRLLVFLKKFNIPLPILHRLVFNFWREYIII
jgi:glycosyltransferase involved in cell wall biosynthesis